MSENADHKPLKAWRGWLKMKLKARSLLLFWLR